MSALSRAALVGSSVRCLRSWDLRRIIWWARLRLKSRTSSKRGELQGSSLCAQRKTGLVATCSSIRADPRLRPGRTGTGAEALSPACPIPRGREKRATENASTARAPRTVRGRESVGGLATRTQRTQRSAARTTLVLLPPEPPPRRPGYAHRTGALRRLCA